MRIPDKFIDRTETLAKSAIFPKTPPGKDFSLFLINLLKSEKVGRIIGLEPQLFLKYQQKVISRACARAQKCIAGCSKVAS